MKAGLQCNQVLPVLLTIVPWSHLTGKASLGLVLSLTPLHPCQVPSAGTFCLSSSTKRVPTSGHLHLLTSPAMHLLLIIHVSIHVAPSCGTSLVVIPVTTHCSSRLQHFPPSGIILFINLLICFLHSSPTRL